MTADEIRKLFDRAVELALAAPELMSPASGRTAKAGAVFAAAIAACCEVQGLDQRIDVGEVPSVLTGAVVMAAASHCQSRDALLIVIGGLEAAAGLRDKPASLRGQPS